MNIVFLGTPQFAVVPLKSLIDSGNNIVGVVTQPDRLVNRKGKLLPTPVKMLAEQSGLKVYAFESIKKQGVEALKSLNADLFVTAAYGQILSQEILDIPKHGTFNIHASLLPKYRGAAPVQWSVINGEKQTGITIMRTDIGVDTGDIICQQKLDILPEETSGQLLERLSILGGKCILQALNMLKTNTITYTKQDNLKATYARMLKKSDGKLDFSEDALTVVNKIRGLNPDPGCFTYNNGEMIKIHKASVVENDSDNKDNFGKIIKSSIKDGITVLCGKGSLSIEILQPAGARAMSYKDFLLGRKLEEGTILMADSLQ